MYLTLIYYKLKEMFDNLFTISNVEELYDPEGTDVVEDYPTVSDEHTYLYNARIDCIKDGGKIVYRYKRHYGSYKGLVRYLKEINCYNEDDLKLAIDTLRLNDKLREKKNGV